MQFHINLVETVTQRVCYGDITSNNTIKEVRRGLQSNPQQPCMSTSQGTMCLGAAVKGCM